VDGVPIAVLGPLNVDGDASSLGPRDRVVLEVLALRPGEVVAAERLADAVWGESPPPTWNKVVQGCVVRLRKVLGATAIETVEVSLLCRMSKEPSWMSPRRSHRRGR
jgi:DNA-binding SARP family transcriptional activator